ncbi:ATP-binding cassette domain-containing protein, partial [Acinetobacter baumannii]
GTGRGVLVRDWRLAGGFVVESLSTSADLTRVEAPVTAAERSQRNGHRGGVIWMTGLSGSGKSTMLRCINRLVEPSAGAIVVDGTDVTGLNQKDLLEFRRHKFG